MARGKQQRSLAEARLAHVDGDAVLEQRGARFDVADARRLQQRRLAGAIGGGSVGARVEQPARQRAVVRRNRELQRRDTVTARSVDVGARLDQSLGRRAVADPHGPMQRRRAVAARGVHVAPAASSSSTARVSPRCAASRAGSGHVGRRRCERDFLRGRAAEQTRHERRAGGAAATKPARCAYSLPSDLERARAVAERGDRHVELV